MRTIETTATITAEGTLTVQVPPDIPPGPHHVVVLIDDQPDLPEAPPRPRLLRHSRGRLAGQSLPAP